MLNMSQQYADMYQDYPSNRSPGTSRGYAGLTLNRQPSRHFDYANASLSGLYTAEDHAQRYEPPARFDRIPSATLASNYPYENQTWSYGAANPASNMGGTGRAKSQGRPRLPVVSNPLHPPDAASSTDY
jgi:hypothetical protein